MQLCFSPQYNRYCCILWKKICQNASNLQFSTDTAEIQLDKPDGLISPVLVLTT